MYERFKSLCEKMGKTMKQVCNDLEISQGTVSNWKKRNSIPSGDLLSKMSKYFDVSMDYLLTGSDETFEEASDKLDTEAGYLFYCLKEMGYTGDFKEDTFVIESFDKKERYVLSNQNYVLMTALMKDVDKQIIKRFMDNQEMGYDH